MNEDARVVNNIVTRVQSLNDPVSVSQNANIIGKNMHPTILLLTMGK